MGWQAWFTGAVVLTMIVGLVRYAQLADVIFLGALALLTLAGILSPTQALAGFANEGVVTVGALFVVAGGMVQTGCLSVIARWILGRSSSDRVALRRLLPPAAISSAFLNNTTIVAMGMPAVLEWSRKHGVAASRLLLPLSYAAILGGVCSLIGTSTNLVVDSQMRQSGVAVLENGLGMWELGAAGVPIAVVGLLYLIYVAPRLLPDRKEFIEQLGETRREYLAEVVVEPQCPLIGKSVQDAGLRGLPGLFLIEIDRGGALISPVGPDERICAGDRFVFTGVVSTIVDLQKNPGLTPAETTTYEIDPKHRHDRRLFEAVVSPSSPLIGRGVRAANFRALYDAAVVAIHRNGGRVRQKIGDVRLRSGDTLLLEAGTSFERLHRNNPDFFLVSQVGDSAPVRAERARTAAAIGVGMVLCLSMPEILRWIPGAGGWSEWFSEQRAILALLAAGLMVATRCVSASAARRSVDWTVLLAIGASIGVGKAMSTSGLAAAAAHGTVGALEAFGAIGVLACLYILAWLLTEVMSNNAAAALMFPLAVAAAGECGVAPRGFVVAITLGASAGFVFPAGYQTHLMVFGPGGYRVMDFVRAGAPMVLIWLVLCLLLIPPIWM